MMKPSRAVTMIVVVLLAAAAGTACAQGYPTRPIRFILANPPGGGTDVVARIVAHKMSQDLGQQVLVDNRPGAGGSIGTQLAVQAPPDGYTIVLGLPATITVAPAIYKNLPYDPLTDLMPVALVGTSAYVLTVHPSLPVRSVSDLVRLARSRPGEIHYAAGPVGAGNQLAAELFKSMTATRMLHIPYKGGGPALVGIMSGEAQVLFGSMLTVVPHIRSGKLRALGVTSSTRATALPELPTIAEAGVRGYDVPVWFGVFVPKKTPQPVIDVLNAEITRIMNDPAIKKNLANQGFETQTSTPDGLKTMLKAEAVKWAQVVKASGAKLD